jgi:hypothetical protein
MMTWAVEVRGNACDHILTFEDYEWDSALVYFLQQQRYDRKVSLISYGEEYEEE